MNITLVTCGSRGDVQPMLALSLALQGLGHGVKLIAPPENAAWITGYGCRFQPLGVNAMSVIMNRAHVHTLKSAIDFLRYIRNELKTQLALLPGMIRNSDLVLGTGLALGLPAVSESLGIPYRFIAFTPHLFPSQEHPFLAVREQWLPPVVNRLTWNLANNLDRFFIRATINEWRIRENLKPTPNNMHHLLGSETIVACDRELAAVPPDTEIHHVQTGYMHLKQKYIQNPELERFLAKGSPPIFAGFGSMQGSDQREVMRLIIGTIKSTGKRVIFSHSWSRSNSVKIDDDCLFIKNIPHLQFFPRLEAVIHHGGSGTTATAALAGVPQVIVPHVLDQFYWAERVKRIGIGPKPVGRSRLTAARLLAAIREVCADPDMKPKSELISEGIKKRDGIGLTVETIEKISH